MSNIFFISDTHFGHANIIKFGQRPFDNVEEMDEALIENWNKVVKKDDLVWHLGDVVWRVADASKYLFRLNGRINLIIGNHDDGHDERFSRSFRRMRGGASLFEKTLLLTHYPVHPSSFEYDPANKRFNLHGHVHQHSIDDPRYVNLSVENINYTPMALEDVLQRCR